jgi:hypothetical protein
MATTRGSRRSLRLRLVIQRLDTSGGLAPASVDCTPARSGAIAEVPYTAASYFWKESA